ncbi:hypothetical protein SKAU_G00224620 [Synaphobranchus kaupii]|uniref:Uncharacterized protein n=1 Tax=Synaphobranchus kaupii TaxID=118154 RepID=A0A9Q1FBM3_SYNKA|nr:hypothetical protein SKAU_G00224620 [Synaphobranchus kaupii]
MSMWLHSKVHATSKKQSLPAQSLDQEFTSKDFALAVPKKPSGSKTSVVCMSFSSQVPDVRCLSSGGESLLLQLCPAPPPLPQYGSRALTEKVQQRLQVLCGSHTCSGCSPSLQQSLRQPSKWQFLREASLQRLGGKRKPGLIVFPKNGGCRSSPGREGSMGFE